jgi:hypothetical protein
MKVIGEISYILKDEPEEFKLINNTFSRCVYIWSNRRGYLDSDKPWQTFSRLSTMDKTPDFGFMEVWTDDKNDISDPPNDTDDMWSESYKHIEKKNYTLEWHKNINQLRITWIQNLATLKDHKIITQVISEIENLGLGFPSFPLIHVPNN